MLEVGQLWITENGRKVRIIRREGNYFVGEFRDNSRIEFWFDRDEKHAVPYVADDMPWLNLVSLVRPNALQRWLLWVRQIILNW